ncbi:MAG: hypothetical protein LBJ12_00755 [Oscillospiraceae bacterium]|jgi:hypothetical protein|nr:hypothetical protein [Oscillospiraceae bacterium]
MDKQKDTTKAKPKKRKVSHKKGRGDRIIPIIEKIIAVVLVLALVSLVGYTVVVQTGFIEKTFSVAKTGDERIDIALYNYSYRQAYGNLFSQYAQYWSYLGASAGYDIEKAPSDQAYVASDDQIAEFPEAAGWKTWADVLEFQTIKGLQRSIALYLTAKEMEGTVESSSVVTVPVSSVAATTNEYGATEPSTSALTSVQTIISPYNSLTAEEKAEIDAQIRQAREDNAAQNISLNASLARQYGHGFTEKVLRNQMALEILANRLAQGKLEEFRKVYTDAKCTEFYKANLVKYGTLDYRIFTKLPDIPEQKDGEKDEAFAKRKQTALEKSKNAAKDILKKITDEKSFLAQAEIQGKAQASDKEKYEFNAAETLNSYGGSSNINAISEKTGDEIAKIEDFQSDAAKWAFSKDRKAGNIGLYFSADGTANFIYIVRPVYSFTPATVREIVIAPQSTSTDSSTSASTYTDAEVAAAKKKAQDVLASYNKGKKTAESFANLAKGNSSGSTKDDGGVQEITSSATQDAAYLAWALHTDRKPGDVTLLTIDKTNYILYFEEKGKETYFDTIATEKSQADYSKYEKELLAQDRFELSIKYSTAHWATKANEKWIRNTAMPYYLNQMQNSSSSSSLFG